jgi:hypothetical protein
MTTIQPIRHFVLTLAGKTLRGEPITERDTSTLEGIRSTWPDLQNPVFLYCSLPDHRERGGLVFPDEVVSGSVVGNIQERSGRWICTNCGNGDNVQEDVVSVIS